MGQTLRYITGFSASFSSGSSYLSHMGGMLIGKALKLSDLEGCGAVFLKSDW